ncbi:aspartate/glutamate racemase [Pseudoxanthomonas kalamensis DSM 18571]|uniref:aspartate/glutamate racemase family protein n=1 Tax=Pseudoxanthomonas kalamensis TaxID=289483 RepID=UPI001390B543|nr:aspartate/glutamate racemase family protein [Pseudoxanthomonas kalamensis]KAF1712375.1 aspartate/glutamate racemase [Pseudoxanthomonas kalamensis DSM 18571]
MKNIGLIGGMSWESTALYYQIINREVVRRRGGLRSAPMRIASLDFEEVASRQRRGAWDEMTEILSEAARGLVAGGADCVLIGTNTMHLIAPAVRAAVDAPLIHIAEVTADAIAAAGLDRVVLLGTRFTMEEPFYREVLAARGIDCVVPDEVGRAEVHRVIFDELCQGTVSEASRRALQAIIAPLLEQGAQGVILGCTELPLILGQDDCPVPVFDTTRLHALAAVDYALGGTAH